MNEECLPFHCLPPSWQGTGVLACLPAAGDWSGKQHSPFHLCIPPSEAEPSSNVPQANTSLAGSTVRRGGRNQRGEWLVLENAGCWAGGVKNEPCFEKAAKATHGASRLSILCGILLCQKSTRQPGKRKHVDTL